MHSICMSQALYFSLFVPKFHENPKSKKFVVDPSEETLTGSELLDGGCWELCLKREEQPADNP